MRSSPIGLDGVVARRPACAQPGTAAYGIAWLSRYPADSWRWCGASIPRFPMYLLGPNRVQIVNEEPRAAMLARLDTSAGCRLTSARTLTCRSCRGWNASCGCGDWSATFEAFPGREVLVGDLNMSPPNPSRWTGCDRSVRHRPSRRRAAASARPHPHRRRPAGRTDAVRRSWRYRTTGRLSSTFRGRDAVGFWRAGHLRGVDGAFHRAAGRAAAAGARHLYRRVGGVFASTATG